jgi:hypothetical protein
MGIFKRSEKMNKKQNGLPKKTREEFKKLPVEAKVKILAEARKVLKEQKKVNIYKD